MPKFTLFIILSIFSVYSRAASTPENATGGVSAQEPAAPILPVESSPALDLNAFSTLEEIIPELAKKRVVFIGEQHARYDHHLTQLEIIRRLHALHPQLAIGMEMFQQPFQAHLDDYVAGKIDEQTLLRSTEYYRRWRMDYRNYQPILRFAREHGLPVIALNVPTELTRKVADVGLDGLDEASRLQLPDDIGPTDEDYRQRLSEIFEQHPNDRKHSFEHFLEAQLLWDEGMAGRAAAYLRAHPDDYLVVLAGNQHVAWGSAIPQRLQRRTPVTMASVLNSWDGPIGPGLADYLLLPGERTLPPAGKLGVLLSDDEEQVTIDTCTEQGACAEAGLKAGDRITAIDEHTINDITDLHLALWDKRPGDSISIEVVRKRFLLPAKHLHYTLVLQ